MNVTALEIPELLLFEPRIYHDARGFFVETWKARSMGGVADLPEFVQDNHSRSVRGTLRGLHYQLRHAQGKLVRCARGAVWCAAVDMRRGSATFGRHAGVELSDANHRQLWVPPGFAHGFLVLSDVADVVYKVTDRYDPASERAMRWDSPTLGIAWPLGDIGAPILSSRDAAAPAFDRAEPYP